MDGIENPSAELATLKAEFDELRAQNADLRGEVQALKQHQPAQQPAVGRRGLLAGGGVGALALLASMGGASAASDPTDGDGDLGTSANPWDTYLNGLALDVADISSATTVAEPVVRYDPSVSGFTITIDSDLEGPSGYSQPVVLQEVGGSSNTVTVDTQSGNGVNGGASISLSKAYATTVLYWTGSEWRTDWFTETVDAGTITTDNIGGAGRPYSNTNDYSDVTTYYQRENPSSQTTYTLLDVSDGPKTVLTLAGFGDGWQNPGGTINGAWKLTIDGNVVEPFPSSDNVTFQNASGGGGSWNTVNNIRYDSSLKVEWKHTGSGNFVTHKAEILG